VDVFWAAFGGGAAAGVVTLIAVILGECFRSQIAQPMLVVTMALGRIYTIGGTSQPAVQERLTFCKGETPVVILQAQNTRSKTVTVTTFGFVAQKRRLTFRQKTKSFQFQPRYNFGHVLPYTIPPGGSPLIQAEDSRELIRSLTEAGFSPTDIKYVWFATAAGKEYKGKPTKATIELLTEIQEGTSL